MTARSSLIETALTKRSGMTARLQRLADLLPRIESALTSLSDLRDRLIARLPPSVPGRASLQAINFNPPLDCLRSVQAQMRRIQNRFARQRLQVAVVGHERQGKSKLEQTVSGLNDTAIPTSAGTRCTGARSIIIHEAGAQPRAELIFHSPDEFLHEIIWPFFSIDGLSLGQRPSSLHDLLASPPKLPRQDLPAKLRATYDKLCDIWTAFPGYREYLGRRDTLVVTGDDIRRFLAQHDLAGKPLHLFRAVRNAKVYCQFPHEDLGKLALADLPGLGDHNPNDRSLLRDTLACEADYVIFVRLPAETGDAVQVRDTELYDLALNAIPEIPLHEMCTFAINRRDGDRGNARQCEIFSEEVRRSPIRARDIRIVDASSDTEVGALIQHTLDYLSANIERLDETCLVGVKRAWLELCGSIQQLRNREGDVRAAVGGSSEAVEFSRLFDRLFIDTQTGMSKLVEELRVTENRPAPFFNAAAQRVLLKLDPNNAGKELLPSLAQIERTRAAEDGFHPAYFRQLTLLRARTTDQLATMDDDFSQFLEIVKGKVVEVLSGSGRLDLNGDNPGLFLARLADFFGHDSCCTLAKSLRNLASAQLPYRGFLQHRLRRYLSRLIPDAANDQGRPHLGLDAGGVLQLLSKDFGLTYGELRTALSSFAAEPNQAAMAIVEEFFDRAFYHDEVRAQWRELYWSQRHSVWPQELRLLLDLDTAQREWSSALDELADVLETAGKAEL
jgi:hypothetical protein